MKKMLLALLLCSLMITSLFAGSVVIGNGSVAQNTLPIQTVRAYGWTHFIIPGDAITGEVDITKLEFNVLRQSGSYSAFGQAIYMKLTNESTVTTANIVDPISAGYTQIFDSVVSLSEGWNEITLINPFTYDGTSNLEIYWKDTDYDYQQGYTVFASTSAPNAGAYHHSTSPVLIESPGTQESNYPNTRVTWADQLNFATLVSPANNATDFSVALDAQLTWTYEGAAVDGFEVIFNGAGPVDVASNVFTFNPGALEYYSSYSWSVKPYILVEASKAIITPDPDPVYVRNYPTGDMPVWYFATMAEPIVYPNWATNSMPMNGMGNVSTMMVNLSWYDFNNTDIDGYDVVVNNETVGSTTELTYQLSDLDYLTAYTWGVKPYVYVASKGTKWGNEKRYPQGDMPTSTFTTTNAFDDDTPPFEIAGTTITLNVSAELDEATPAGFGIGSPQVIAEPVIVLPDDAGNFLFGATIAQSVPGTFTFTFYTEIYEGNVYVDGVFYGTVPANGIVIIEIYYDASKEGHEVAITDGDSTLPVTLSSFTAVANANEYVSLQWVTQSESNLHGYNVYRAESDSFQQAMRINSTVVAANNTSQTSNYTYTDREVESTTYYYWLEVSELSNENTFHGPIEVIVEDETVVPGISATTFGNFGPSPFTNSTSTNLRVKEGETASLTIYNLLGQVVSRESFNAGEHNFVFNGKDLNNKKVANGIYFVKMTSPTTSKSFKIVKIK